MPNFERSPRFLTLLLGTTALVGVAVLPSAAMATDFWIGGTNDWYTAGNWTTGVPDNTTAVSIGTTSPNPTVINGGNAFTGDLYLSNVPTLTSSLTLQNGAKLSSWSGVIGYGADADATMLVTGASSWDMAFDLFVGDDATGALTISGASTVKALNTWIGDDAGSSGTVLVTGTGSSLSIGNAVVVGDYGTGVLTISNGATVTDKNGVVAEMIGSKGTVTVTGAGSTWTNANRMIIGDYGAGSVIVENGGTVNNGPGFSVIGVNSTGAGTVTVTGAGSTMNDAGPLIVGGGGNGTLNILAGGAVNDEQVTVASNQNFLGDITVDGAGSQWNVDSSLVVGDAGQGTMTISNGSKVTDVDATIGKNAVGIGYVTVTDAGSSWTNTGALNIGYDAVGNFSAAGGTLKVLKGGAVSADYVSAATNAGSSATVLIDGANSKLTATHDVTLGEGGTAMATISNGGLLSDANGHIGKETGSSGTVGVIGAGSQWNNSGSLTVGDAGQGVLHILSGAVVTDDDGVVGAEFGSKGSVVVDGTGSKWTNSGTVYVGSSGDANVLVGNGGQVSSAFTEIGFNANSAGTVTVGGAGSSWEMGASLGVGYSGDGSLSVLGGGTVKAGSVDLAFGLGSVGTVVIDGAGSKLTSSLGTHIGTDGTGKMTLSNGGTLASNTLVIGDGTGSGKLVIGAGLADAPAAAGYLTAYDAPTHSVDLGISGNLVFNHTDDNYIFDAILAGNGTIDQKFGTTYLTSNSTGYTGNIYVTDGKLVVNADYSNATAIVSDGGTLGGFGTLLNLTAHSGATITPGNSIGTLHVDNMATFEAGSTYEAEVNAAGASDLIDVGGVADIDAGTVAVLAAPGQYAPSTQYTIVTAAGGVNGAYTNATVNSAFLAASLDYDANNVYLTLDRINATMFNDVGGTPNQKATGAGLDSIAVGNDAAEALALQRDAAKRAALDQLSGELHGSIKSAALEDSRFVREAINGRLLDPAASGVWSHGYGSFGSVEGDGNAAGLERQTGGLFVGADGAITDGWRFGLIGGYSIGNYDVSDRGSSASAESYNAGVYTSFAAGGLSFRLGADYAVHQIDTDRTIAFTGFSDEDVASYAAQTAQGFGEVGYKIEAGPASFEPYAAVAYVSQSTDGFSETGGDSALTAEADVVAATFTTLGVRAEAEVDLGDATGTLRGSLGWRHAFGDLSPTSTMSFGGGELFAIDGVPLAEDAAVVDLGFDIAVSGGATLGASYSGVISEAGYDHGAKAHLGWQF